MHFPFLSIPAGFDTSISTRAVVLNVVSLLEKVSRAYAHLFPVGVPFLIRSLTLTRY